MKVLSNSLKKGAFVSLALSLVACTEPLSPTALPSNPPAPRAATPPPPSVEKIQLQAGSGSSDPHAITELKVEPAQLELRPLEVAKVRVLARLANGQTVEVINHSKLQWEIAEPTQITLLNGTVKALAPGESEVLIRAGTQEARLKVKIPEVLDGGSASGSILVQPELVLPQPLYRLAVGENVYLQASLKAADGSESKDLIFSVDKPDLFELDSQSGRLRRLKAGPAKVTVQARLNGDLLKTIALEDKVIESHSAGGGGGGGSPVSVGSGGSSVIAVPIASNSAPIPNPSEFVNPTPTPLPTGTLTVIPTATPVPDVMPSPTTLPLPTATPTVGPVVDPSPTPMPTPFSSPSVQSDIGKIVFSSRRDGNSEIYVMKGDGTEQIRLTDSNVGDVCPDWSPDGNKIIFNSVQDSKQGLFVMNSDGANVQRITDGLNVSFEGNASWSPDGKKIVFIKNKYIYTMNPDGTQLKSLFFEKGDDVPYPRWAPDSNKIIFHCQQSNGQYDICTINSDGSQLEQITNDIAVDKWPSFSPDGNKIAYVSNINQYESLELFVMNRDGSNRQQITNGMSLVMFPVWSPDSQKIVFTSTKNAGDLYSVNKDGTQLKRLTFTPDNDTYPSWTR